MKISVKEDASSVEDKKYLDFRKSIIKGVEIKRCSSSPYDYKPHVHNELTLGYILEGSTDLTISDGIIHYEKGNGVVIPPLTTHRCAPNDIEHWAYIILFIEPDYYNDLVSFHTTRRLDNDRTQKLIEFIDQLLIEDNQDILENILVELILEYGDESKVDHIMTEASNIEFIHNYIIDHVNDMITLEYLQEISGLNKFTLIRNFKKSYVTTPAAFHLQCRVAEAKKLIAKGEDILEVCNLLNFCDQAHLIREFKKMYGITPTAYTEQLK